MSGQEQEDSRSILGGEWLMTACWKEGLGDLSWVRWGPQSRPLLLFHTCEYQREGGKDSSELVGHPNSCSISSPHHLPA